MVMSFTQGHEAGKRLGQRLDQVVRPLTDTPSGSQAPASSEAPSPLHLLRPPPLPLPPAPLAGAFWEQTIVALHSQIH